MNLGKRKFAHHQLLNKIHDLDGIATQEPYLIKNTLPGIPLSWALILCNNGTNSVTFILPTKCAFFKQYTTTNIIMLSLNHFGSELMVINVYPALDISLEPTLEELQQCMDMCDGKDVILMGDFNAKCPLWGNSEQNHRGTLLIGFCTANNLSVVNDLNS